MTVVADSSPLIILSKLQCFDLLKKLYSEIYISAEVYREVVIAGAGLPGASEVANSEWIEVRQLRNESESQVVEQTLALGAGELSTILLAREIHADHVLLDDQHARKFAHKAGLQVRGTVGLLEVFYTRGLLSDLRSAFKQLIVQGVYVDPKLLNRRLHAFGLALL